MPLTFEQIEEQALLLPSASRALLAEKLVESLDRDEEARLQKLWLSEAKRRRDEVRRGEVKSVPGDEALAQVRRLVGR